MEKSLRKTLVCIELVSEFIIKLALKNLKIGFVKIVSKIVRETKTRKIDSQNFG